MGIYSNGKAALEAEQAHRYSPEEILAVAKATQDASKQVKQTLIELELAAAKAQSTIHSLPDVGAITKAISSLTVEFSSLKAQLETLTVEVQNKTALEKAAAQRVIDALTESQFEE